MISYIDLASNGTYSHIFLYDEKIVEILVSLPPPTSLS